MLAVVIDSFGPITGDEEPTAAVSSAVEKRIVGLVNDVIRVQAYHLSSYAFVRQE
jgi:hypothetical protein